MTGYPLLSTKLFLPPTRSGQVTRPRLLERLDACLQPGMRLALISAPAGFGKTSLLAEWAARCERTGRASLAWLALDEGDQEAGRLLSYLLAAIERCAPGLASGSSATLQAALNGAEPLSAQAVLAELVNELAALNPARPLVIAFDDAQFMHAPAARDALVFLIENLPPGARLAIATRSDPPLALARLRARGQMVELRAAHLRFSEDEARAFLADGMGLRLPAAEAAGLVQTLTARTEGWAAGLQMAGLALQTAERPPAELVGTFSGSHRFVIDYLAEEVLANLPAGLVSFLLQTAVLERFCAPLCRAVVTADLNGQDQPLTLEEVQDLLVQLERANLFLVPLDSERQWFRYHHLFADLLRARLKQLAPQRVAGLQRAASHWFEANALPGEALHYALAAAQQADDQPAADFERAARLVENHTLALFRAGQMHALQGWIDLLPAGLSEQRPLFCVYRAWVQLFAGRIEAVEPLLQAAERAAHPAPIPEPGEREPIERGVSGQIAAIRCHQAMLAGRIDDAQRLAQAALEQIGDPAAWLRSFVEWSLGYAARLSGDLPRAAALFSKNFQLDQAAGDPWGTAMQGIDLGSVRRMQGHLRESIAVYQAALAVVEARGARRLGYTGRLLTALAGSLYQRNELESARRYLEEALVLNQRWQNPNHMVFSYVTMARVETAEKRFVEAAALLEQAEAVMHDWPVLATLGRLVEAARLTIVMAQGHVPASAALDSLIAAALDPNGYAQGYSEAVEIQRILAARLLLAQSRANPERSKLLLPHLDRLEAAARAAGRGEVLIDVLVLQALARAHPAPLVEALALAEPEGYWRPFLDAVPLVPGRLVGLLEQSLLGSTTGGQALAAGLLDQLGQNTPTGAAPAPAARAPQPGLVEPITAREMDVLRLLAEGLTNPQISERLVISPGTVKAHTAAIFRKLDVATRTQAVTMARRLGIIP